MSCAEDEATKSGQTLTGVKSCRHGTSWRKSAQTLGRRQRDMFGDSQDSEANVTAASSSVLGRIIGRDWLATAWSSATCFFESGRRLRPANLVNVQRFPDVAASAIRYSCLGWTVPGSGLREGNDNLRSLQQGQLEAVSWGIPPAVFACHHGVRSFADVQPCGQPCGQVQRQRRQRGSSDWIRWTLIEFWAVRANDESNYSCNKSLVPSPRLTPPR
eukprot:s1192_g9.t1